MSAIALPLPFAAVSPRWFRSPAERENCGLAREKASTERELVRRSRRGDEEAFRALVDRHRDHAYGLALRITRSREEAEDAAQEAFVRAWLALPRFRGDSSFGTWLHAIVARRALDRAVARRSREARESDIGDTSAGAEVPAGEQRDVLLSRRLDRLIARLTPPQRAVVALFYREEQAVGEIAEALGMPPNTVKTHLARARAALREAWLQNAEAP